MFSRLRALASESLLVTGGLVKVLDLHRMATRGFMCLNLKRCYPIKAEISREPYVTIWYNLRIRLVLEISLDISLCIIC